MNEFERISLEFDIALENSEYMMDTIYSVLSIEGNNIYLKESSGEVDEEELDDMYTEAVGKFMEKARKLFDTIIEAIKKFFTQLSTAIKTKIRQSQINKKLDEIEKGLANAKTKELKKKGHTADPRKLVVLYKQFTKEVISAITKCFNKSDSKVEDLDKEISAIISSDKYKDFSLEELDIISTSIKENINFTKSELRNMDRMNAEILNISVSAEEKLKEYATKANNSDMVNAIHSAGAKIASTGKKVGKLASDHPFITAAIIYKLYLEVQPHIIHGVEKVASGKKGYKERKEEKIKEKRKNLNYDLETEIIKDRYGYDLKNSTLDDVNKIMDVSTKNAFDNAERWHKYGEDKNDRHRTPVKNNNPILNKPAEKGPINKDKINEAFKKNKEKK